MFGCLIFTIIGIGFSLYHLSRGYISLLVKREQLPKGQDFGWISSKAIENLLAKDRLGLNPFIDIIVFGLLPILVLIGFMLLDWYRFGINYTVIIGAVGISIWFAMVIWIRNSIPKSPETEKTEEVNLALKQSLSIFVKQIVGGILVGIIFALIGGMVGNQLGENGIWLTNLFAIGAMIIGYTVGVSVGINVVGKYLHQDSRYFFSLIGTLPAWGVLYFLVTRLPTDAWLEYGYATLSVVLIAPALSACFFFYYAE